jgi:hypothetical protein
VYFQHGQHPRRREAGGRVRALQVRRGDPASSSSSRRAPAVSRAPGSPSDRRRRGRGVSRREPLKEGIVITCGDPSGIGPEIVSAWLAANPAEAKAVAVVGPARWLATLPKGPQTIAVGMEDYAAELGRPTGEGSLVAWAALERAAALCRSGEFAGVVSAPVSKERMAAIGWGFPRAHRVLRRPLGRGADDGLLRRKAPGRARLLAHSSARGARHRSRRRASPARSPPPTSLRAPRAWRRRGSGSAASTPTRARAGSSGPRSAT